MSKSNPTYSDTDKFNDRVFGTGWLGIGLIILWLGFYVMVSLPDQPFSDVAYFISLIFFFLGTVQVRRGRDLNIVQPKTCFISNMTYILSACLYCGCLLWFKLNFETILESESKLNLLRYIIVTAFILLSLAVSLNWTPNKAAEALNNAMRKVFSKKAGKDK